MNLLDDIESTILLLNNTPLEDFLGLSPNEIQYLFYDPFSDKSYVQLREDFDNKTLDL